MKKIVLICLLLIISFFPKLASAQYNSVLPKIKPQTFNVPTPKLVKSPKGITAWLIEEKNTPIIAVSIISASGSTSDPKHLKGLSEVAVSLMGNEIGNYSAKELTSILTENAINLSFTAGIEHLSATMTTSVEKKKLAFKLLKLALTEPRFSRNSIKEAKLLALTKIKQEAINPNTVAYKKFMKYVYKKHPYGNYFASKSGIKRINRHILKDWVKNRWTKDKLFIGVVGNINEQELSKLLDKTFGKLPNKSRLKAIPDFEVITKQNIEVKTLKNLPQSSAWFGQKGVARSDKDFFTLYVLNQLIGGVNLTSKLSQSVREELGLTYGVTTSLFPLKHGPIFLGFTNSANNKMAKTIKAIQTQWEKLYNEGTTKEELEDTKSFITGSFPLSFISSSDLASFLASLQYNNEDIDYLKTRNEKMNAITIDDANRVIKRIFNPENLFFVVVGIPSNL
ncbi:MAG: insulinase family protein [Alphaproteobacteria bacterium]|nr:insulinase family protein [Alphaproteobacteria bacterium]